MPSYTTSWANYGPMLEWAMMEAWWHGFINGLDVMSDMPTYRKMFNPLRGSTAIAEFLKEKGI